MSMPFHPFSREHFITVAIGAIVTAILIVIGKRGGRGRIFTTALLAFFNLTAWPFSLAAWASLGKPLPLDNILPFHLCDVAALLAGFALLTRKPLLCTLTYFWGLAATFQALLTPALSVGFPEWAFFTFFIQHFSIVATALYLPLVEDWRPQQPLWKSPLQVYRWSLLYLTFVLTVNSLLGTNFGFVSHPPENPSLIDHLGPWPWYLISMQVLALGLFFLLALPLSKKTLLRSSRETLR